MGQWC